MRNSAIRRVDSDESVKQDERLGAMEKVLAELARGQQEVKAEQATREAALVRA
jgi:hypothetical protein